MAPARSCMCRCIAMLPGLRLFPHPPRAEMAKAASLWSEPPRCGRGSAPPGGGHRAEDGQTSRSSLGGRSQRRPALVAGNRPPKPDHSISAPNPTQHGTMRRSGSTNTGNELGAATSSISEPYMLACTTNPAVPAMIKQPTPSSTASGRSAICDAVQKGAAPHSSTATATPICRAKSQSTARRVLGSLCRGAGISPLSAQPPVCVALGCFRATTSPRGPHQEQSCARPFSGFSI